ncbi:hypothetical protein [Paenibacillus campinasensis]|nr:hypothetical protein [Paenibacillus campinasensis]
MMNARALLRNDIRQMLKDPMLLASVIGPLAVFVFVRYLFRPLSVWVEERYAFDMMSHAEFAAMLLLTVIPLLAGVMTGLLMLDERDENLIAYFAVTPLTRKGYYRYRLLLPSGLACLMSAVYLLFGGIVDVRVEMLYPLLLTSAEAPCIALFLAAFAANKVEGLALSKLCGLLFVGPVLVFFVPGPWQAVGIILPTYWPSESYLQAASGESGLAAVTFGIGAAYHMLLLYIADRAFAKRMD